MLKNKSGGKFLFVKKSFSKFKTIGSFFPSSKYLTLKMLEPVKMFPKICIVELGAGSGAFTEVLLSKLPDDGKLFVFEIDKQLCDFLNKEIRDKRVKIICDNAINIKNNLAQEGHQDADYIISGLPLGNMSPKVQKTILESIKCVMKKESVFIQFQYFLVSWFLLKKFFSAKIVTYELRNFPPAFIYQCKLKQLNH